MGQFRILVLEDDPLIALHLTTVLEDLRYDVLAVNEPEDALNRLAVGRPDAVVLNYCFGRGRKEKAREVLQQIRLLRLPVLWVTGARETDVHQGERGNGHHSVLYKPFARHQLKDQLQRLRNLHQGIAQ